MNTTNVIANGFGAFIRSSLGGNHKVRLPKRRRASSLFELRRVPATPDTAVHKLIRQYCKQRKFVAIQLADLMFALRRNGMQFLLCVSNFSNVDGEISGSVEFMTSDSLPN